MNDITNLHALGEDSYEAVNDIIHALEIPSSQEQKNAVFNALADLLESLREDFSGVRRMEQPRPDTEKSERVDVLVNWLREKAQS